MLPLIRPLAFNKKEGIDTSMCAAALINLHLSPDYVAVNIKYSVVYSSIKNGYIIFALDLCNQQVWHLRESWPCLRE